eukprot:tig00021122_g18438.t1
MPSDTHSGGGYELAVRIIDGRNFPRLKGSRALQVAAKFAGQMRTTQLLYAGQPGANPSHTPVWREELVWRISERELQAAKANSAHVKVQFFIVDSPAGPQSQPKSSDGQRTAIGYVVLDLRQAQYGEAETRPRWYPLHSINTALKLPVPPEARIQHKLNATPHGPGAALERREAAGEVSPARRRSVESLPGTAGASYEGEEGGEAGGEEENFCQIGEGGALFTLTVAVAAAENLAFLAAPGAPPRPHALAASFHGVEVYRSAAFEELERPPDLTREPGGAACRVTLRSSPRELRHFFLANPAPLRFSLLRLPRPAAPAADSPGKPGSGGDEGEEECVGTAAVALGEVVGEDLELRAFRDAGGAGRSALVPFVDAFVALSAGPPSAAPAPRLPRPAAGPRGAPGPSRPPRTAAPRRPRLRPPPPLPSLSPRVSTARSAASGGAGRGAWAAGEEAEEARHYRFGVELRALGDLRPLRTERSPPLLRLACRYSYPALGAPGPVSTPPVELRVGLAGEEAVRGGYAAFEVAMERSALYATLAGSPLLVEVVQVDGSARDALLGVATLRPSELLKAAPARAGPAVVRALELAAPVVAFEDESVCRRVATLRAALTLEDLGPVPPTGLPAAPPAPQPIAAPPAHPSTSTAPSGAGAGPVAGTPGTAEYQAAWELEMWKAGEEAKFRAALKEREVERMRALEEEWRRREREREAGAQRREKELAALEARLKQAAFELEKREQRLVLAEEASSLTRDAAVREANRKVQEAQDGARRVKEEFAHQLGLERKKLADLDGHCLALQQRLKGAEEQARRGEEELAAARAAARQSPEVALQAELARVQAERAELARRAEAAERAKKHYKEQLARCLRELGRMRRALQAEAAGRMGRERSELEALKLQYLAKEEGAALQADHAALRELRRELAALRAAPGPAPGPAPPRLTPCAPPCLRAPGAG